jgi:hypothetical protein
MFKGILYNFTRAVSSGVTLAKVAARKILPNLYLVNRRDEDIAIIYSGDYPVLFPQAYGEFLDRIGFSFGVDRLPEELDEPYRQRILFSFQKNATIGGIESGIRLLLNFSELPLDIKVIEAHKNFFDAETSNFDTPLREPNGSLLFRINILVSPKEVNRIKKPIYFRHYEDLFNVFRFSLILEEIVAAGIEINSVLFLAPGAGGDKGDFNVDTN